MNQLGNESLLAVLLAVQDQEFSGSSASPGSHLPSLLDQELGGGFQAKSAMDIGSGDPMDESSNGGSKGTTSIHVTALDGLVNVNSLFTLAVFVGLSFTAPGQTSLEENSACNAGKDISSNLLTFQVISFSSFLFSSLVAQGLKQAIILFKNRQVREVFKAHINKKILRAGMVFSATGSVVGCICLMLALVDVIQIKLGTLSCGSIWTIRAIIPLVTLVPIALIIYVSTILYAFLH